MSASLKTIILAAGKGTRFKSELPKVLHCLAGKPVIDYVINVAQAVGSLKTYVVVGHKAENVAAVVKDRAEIVLQKEQLGTAHAVRMCAAHLKDHKGLVLVMCGDTPLLDKSLIRQLITKSKRQRNACTVLTANIANPFGYGRIIRSTNGKVAAIREEKDASDLEKNISEINTGVYCFDAQSLFAFITRVKKNEKKQEFYLTDVIALFLEQGLKVDALVTDDWTANLGINSREDLALAEQIYRKKILKQLMADGVTIVDPDTTYVESHVKIGQDTIIYPCSYIHEGVEIGKNCSVGPFARLRPGTRLGDHVTVGNFAEVSRSKLDDGATMKHFSFLGDAVVGKNANIGCGAVTANYDGKNKNKTVIGNKAFIGCDSILVAPVSIGDGAVAGAGSVVTHGRDIPPGMIAVGVPARVVKRVRDK